jgi:hypothetical protein
MQEALVDSRKKLTALQCYSDAAYRRGECGDLFLCQISQLKICYDKFISHHTALHQSLEQWVQQSVTLFQRCDTAYQTIFLSMYTSLERPRRANEPPPVLKPTNVPIDAECALNIIDFDPDAPFTLYNDNETLFKFPQSNLTKVRQIDARVKEIETYFEKECLVIHDHVNQVHCENYQLLEDVEAIMNDLPVNDIFDKFIMSLHHISHLHGKEKENCALYSDNLMKKMLVVAQLKDNLFRAYYYTKSQKISHVRSVF